MDDEQGTVLEIKYKRDIDAAAKQSQDSSESETQPFPLPPQPAINPGKKGIIQPPKIDLNPIIL